MGEKISLTAGMKQPTEKKHDEKENYAERKHTNVVHLCEFAVRCLVVFDEQEAPLGGVAADWRTSRLC